jgi:hypothetical protein
MESCRGLLQDSVELWKATADPSRPNHLKQYITMRVLLNEVTCIALRRDPLRGPAALSFPPFNKVHNKMEDETEQINISGSMQLRQRAQERHESRFIVVVGDSSHVRRVELLIGSANSYMYHLLYHSEILHFTHTAYLWVPYGSRDKQRLIPYTAITGWALQRKRSVSCEVRTEFMVLEGEDDRGKLGQGQ